MSKESGLGAQFYLDEYDLSNDTNALGGISKTINLLDMTGIDKSAMERKAGQLSGSMALTTFFNPTNAHTAYSSLPRADRQMSYFHRATLGAPVASMIGKQVGYNPTRAADGQYTAEVESQSNAYWLDWGLALTAGKRTDTAATSPASGVDFSLQGDINDFDYGLQAYLHVFTFTGTSATITIQDSANNSSFAAIGSGVAFATVTGVTKERIASGRTQAVRRYLRVITTGTFSNLVFAVQATVNTTEMTI